MKEDYRNLQKDVENLGVESSETCDSLSETVEELLQKQEDEERTKDTK